MDYTVLSKPTCPYSQAAIKFFKYQSKFISSRYK